MARPTPARRAPVVALLAVLLFSGGGAAATWPPLHPGQAVHRRVVTRLCDRVSYTIRGLPLDGVYIDEWVNGREMDAWDVGGGVTWFFGYGVGGRAVRRDNGLRVQANHYDPGCVRLVVAAWWKTR